MAPLVIRRHRDIDILQRRVRVAQRNDGDVGVACLPNGQGIGARVRREQQPRLCEGARDVVRETTRRETAVDRFGAGVCCEFQNGTAAVGACGNGADVGGVVDGCDDACC